MAAKAQATSQPKTSGQLCAIGVDIGGTAVKIGAVRKDGRVFATDDVPTPIDLPQDAAIREIARAAGRLIARVIGPGDSVVGVGIGCAGLIDSTAGIVHTSPNLPYWKDAPLGPAFESELGYRVAVLNDANAFALAEARIGAVAGLSPVVGLTLGTGVGGAIVVSGRVFGGRHGFAGEVGHMSVDFDGPRCPCGNRGCLELYLGRRALAADYLRATEWRAGDIVYDLASGEREVVEPKMLSLAAERGDRAAADVFARAGEILGVALVNLANLLDPQAFVIGGGVSLAGERLFAPARRVLRDEVMMGGARAPEIHAAALGMQAGLTGAAFYAFDTLAAGDEAHTA